MVKSQTWIAIILFAALASLAWYLNTEKAKKDAEVAPTTEVKLLFSSADGVVSSLQIDKSSGETVSLEIGKDGAWMVKTPIEGAAETGQVGAATSQITSLRNLSAVDAAPDILGLDNPDYVISVKFTGGKGYKLEVGSVTPSQNGYYARLDGSSVFIVSKDGIDSLISLVTAPPYLATPTASALPPTETPMPATVPQATPTP